MAIYDDVIKKMIFGMPKTNKEAATRGLLGRGGQFGKGKVQGLLGSDDFRQGLGLISAGFRGKGLQEAMIDAEKAKLLRAKRMGTGIGQGKLMTVFDREKGENVLIDENIVRAMPQRYGVKLSDSIIKERAKLSSNIGLLKKIEENYIATDKPVGLIDFGRSRKALGNIFGEDTVKNRQFGTLVTDIDKMTTFLTQAISGAQVSDREAERIKKLIPQLSDSEIVFESKLKSLREYLSEARSQYGGNIEEGIKNIKVDKYLKKIKDEKKAKSKKDFDKLGDDPLGIL